MVLEINHALISATPLDKIEQVYSKDQALAQCRAWLQRHLPHAQAVQEFGNQVCVWHERLFK